MFHNKAAIHQLLRVAAGEVVCVALMLGVYALIGRFSTPVLGGAIFGCIAAIAYFLSLSITVSKAVDRVQETGEASKATRSIQASSSGRYIVLALVYIVILKAGLCDPVASVLPLLFLPVSINVTEYFRKDGESKK